MDADMGRENSDLSYSAGFHSFSALISVFCGQGVCNRTRNYPRITQNDADVGKENALSAGKIRSFGAFAINDSSGQSALISVFCGQRVRNRTRNYPRITQMDADMGQGKI
jgi:hypothetical protein